MGPIIRLKKKKKKKKMKRLDMWSLRRKKH
jgi:hypothetical protein